MQTTNLEQKKAEWAKAITREAVKMLTYVRDNVHGDVLLQPDMKTKTSFAFGFTDLCINDTLFIGRYSDTPIPTDCPAEFTVTATEDKHAPDAEFLVNDGVHLELRVRVHNDKREHAALRSQIIASIMNKDFQTMVANKLSVKVANGKKRY